MNKESEFVEKSKFLCSIARDLDNVTIGKLSSLENIQENIERLKKDILNQTDLTSQRIISYILLKNINNIKLGDIESYMNSLKEKDYSTLKKLINDEELFTHVKEQLNLYQKNNPFQNWTAQSILEHTYYFAKYDNSDIKTSVQNIAESFKTEMLNSENFEINANSFYVSRVSKKSWFLLYPKNNKKYNHKKFAQLHMSFGNGNIVFGLGKGDEFKDNIDKNLQITKQIEDINENTYQEIVDYYKEILPTFRELNEKILSIKNPEKKETKMQNDNTIKQPLNQILYGPPGTGKTYNTIDKALEIIFEKEDKEKEFEIIVNNSIRNVTIQKIIDMDESHLEYRAFYKAIFEFYKKLGQIEFVTFHQSYGYEEFVEGIKAQTITDDITKQKTITYDVEAGVFKRLCEQAKTIKSEKTSAYNFDKNINIWKVSLGDSQNSEDEYLFDYCIENNKILLGFGDGIDFNECKSREEIAKKLNDTEKYSYPPTAINTLKNKIKIGDIVLVSYGNRKLRAIAKITGEYQHIEDDNLKSYVQSRDVEWLLVPEEPFSYEKVLKKQFSQMTIYDIKSNVKIEELRKILTQDNKPTDENNKNYILIIDEINRGNISKIFGELITLIEPSKRIGADEEIRIKLPYSGDEFGVSQNLYIIGTMNTADRSIAPIDTALRRRFVFEEMAPDSSLLKDIKVKDKESDTGIELDKLLESINTRIEYLYDRDHTIGHAYLIDVKTLDDLRFAFKNKIIPLLAEYFYEDWENIKLVLDDNENRFITVKEKGNHQALSGMDKNYNKKLYSVNDIDSLEAEDFINIYPKEGNQFLEKDTDKLDEQPK